MAEEVPVAERRAEHGERRERLRELLVAIELRRHRLDEAEVAVERPSGVGVLAREALLVFAEAVRDAHAIARDHDVVEALGVEPHPRHLGGEAERAEQPVDRLALAAAEDVVDLRAEAEVADAEGVRVAARRVVRLEDEDLAACPREHGRGREPRHPRADHEVVHVGRRSRGRLGVGVHAPAP